MRRSVCFFSRRRPIDLASLDIPNPLCYIPRTDFQIAERAVPSIAAGKFLPNRMLFHFLQGLEATAGRTAAALIWNSAGGGRECLSSVPDDLEKAIPFECFSALCAAVEVEFGESGSRGILQRCGRTAFTHTLRSTASIAGIDGPPLRASPGADRIAAGLESVVRLLKLISDMECSLIALPRSFRIRVSACPECAGRRSAGRACHGIGGMLRGALDWFGIDPAIPVTELECIAGGAPVCEFTIAGAL